MTNNNTPYNHSFRCWMMTLLLFLVVVAPTDVQPGSCFSNAHTRCSVSTPSKLSHGPEHHVSQVNKRKTCCDSLIKPTSSRQCHCEKTTISDFFKTPAIIPPQNQWDNQPAKHFRMLSRAWINVPILHPLLPPQLLRQPISFALTVVNTTVLLI
jgi:hypothetical protein